MSKKYIRLSVLELENLGITLALEDTRRLAACWNACSGISTENLEDNVQVKELARRYNETIRQRDELLAALLWVIWHHQGGSSDTGQPIRRLLGIGPHDRLTNEQLLLAKSFSTNMKGGGVKE